MKRIIFIIAIFVVPAAVQISRASEKPKEIINILLNKEIKKGETESIETAPKENKVTKEKSEEDKPFSKSKTEEKKKITLSPSSPEEVLFKTGIQLYESSSFSAALRKFDELKKKYAQSPFRDTAAIWAGKINLKLQKYDRAMKEFTSIKEESGEYPHALFLIGETRLHKGLKTKAVESFYKISSQFPEFELADDALIKLAKIYLSDGKGNQSLESSIKVVKYYPNRETVDDAFYLIGKVYERDPLLKDFEIARKIYKIFLVRAQNKENRHFWGSPLKKKVEQDLKYLEATYFTLEN